MNNLLVELYRVLIMIGPNRFPILVNSPYKGFLIRILNPQGNKTEYESSRQNISYFFLLAFKFTFLREPYGLKLPQVYKTSIQNSIIKYGRDSIS